MLLTGTWGFVGVRWGLCYEYARGGTVLLRGTWGFVGFCGGLCYGQARGGPVILTGPWGFVGAYAMDRLVGACDTDRLLDSERRVHGGSALLSRERGGLCY